MKPLLGCDVASWKYWSLETPHSLAKHRFSADLLVREVAYHIVLQYSGGIKGGSFGSLSHCRERAQCAAEQFIHSGTGVRPHFEAAGGRRRSGTCPVPFFFFSLTFTHTRRSLSVWGPRARNSVLCNQQSIVPANGEPGQLPTCASWQRPKPTGQSPQIIQNVGTDRWIGCRRMVQGQDGPKPWESQTLGAALNAKQTGMAGLRAQVCKSLLFEFFVTNAHLFLSHRASVFAPCAVRVLLWYVEVNVCGC